MYTPTTWATGDTITAEKMNNIENGIVNTPTVAVVSLNAEGFGSASRIFGYMVYATYEDGHWVVTNDNNDSWAYITGMAEPNDRMIPPQYTIIPNDMMCPFFVYALDDTNVQTTGDIEEAENLYFSFGSVVPNAYRIYGNGSIKFIAL